MRGKANVTAKDTIALDYRGLGDGATQAGQICPACEGGSSKEGSLSVTRRGGLLLYNCHRSSCTFGGAIDESGAGGVATRRASARSNRPLVPTYMPNEALVKLLANKHYLPTESIKSAELRWTGDGDGYLSRRVCFPINGPDSKERGKVYRSYENGCHPKSVTQLYADDTVAASWYKWMRKSDTLVIVEDQMSAIKLAPHVHAVALLGTHINEEKAAEIAAGAYGKTIISLDNDATFQAIKLQMKWCHKIKRLYVTGLGKDIKDMTTEEFNEYLSHNVH